MKEIEKLFKLACEQYNGSTPHLDTCSQLALAALKKLRTDATFASYHEHTAHNLSVNYATYTTKQAVSRPIAEALFAKDATEFDQLEKAALRALAAKRRLSHTEAAKVNRYIYTAVMAFAATYDLWKPGSRKTPGTFFEVIMAALVRLNMPEHSLSKHVSLGKLLGDEKSTAEVDLLKSESNADQDDESETHSVSTDIVISSSKSKKAAVIPLKITTRERIVQPFAHQRILESCFPGCYHSFLCCISETQLDKKNMVVKQICVPGTIILFQKFLAHLDGLYYCDIPARYSLPSLTRTIPVKNLGELFNDVHDLLDLPDH